MTKKELLDIFKETGPQTGAQLLKRTQLEALPLWKLCFQTPDIRYERVGRQYLRLDRRVAGYARLSPSIRREFLTYTILGRKDQDQEIVSMAEDRRKEIQCISRTKLELASKVMVAVTKNLSNWDAIADQVCFIIAGDITYEMAHTVPRPEISTGKMVRGSDLDIIVVAKDEVPQAALQELDDAIYKKKHFLLVHPDYREEIDYLIKNMTKVRAQLAFDTFEHMVASKILHEGCLLLGSHRVFQSIKNLLTQSVIPQKLADMEKKASQFRMEAEKCLLHSCPPRQDQEFYNLFYTSQEDAEIY